MGKGSRRRVTLKKSRRGMCFSAARTGKPGLQSARDLRPGWTFTFQQGNEPLAHCRGQHRRGSGTTLWMTLNDPARDLRSTNQTRPKMADNPHQVWKDPEGRMAEDWRLNFLFIHFFFNQKGLKAVQLHINLDVSENEIKSRRLLL